MFGLCEGNHCKGGKKGKEAGNGVIVVAKQRTNKQTNKQINK